MATGQLLDCSVNVEDQTQDLRGNVLISSLGGFSLLYPRASGCFPFVVDAVQLLHDPMHDTKATLESSSPHPSLPTPQLCVL